MDLLFNAVQFIETSLLFSAFLFSGIMFLRTRDKLAGSTFFVVFPVSSLLFISYMYSLYYRSSKAGDTGLEWLSPLFALVVIVLIMTAILATCFYIIKLFPVSERNKRKGYLSAIILVSAFLIITSALVMYISKSDLAKAITNALWAFYPMCSLALFIEAISISLAYNKIENVHDKKLAKYFIISFIPQIAFSTIDFILLRDISFQTTHLSYACFSLLVFIDMCGYFFRSYSIDMDITDEKQSLKESYDLSEREIEVVELLAKGITNQAISEKLHISINTVKSHIKKIYNKFKITNRLQLMNLLQGVKSAHK
jgi:DNA-binding CsgD family transcriptional regulator